MPHCRYHCRDKSPISRHCIRLSPLDRDSNATPRPSPPQVTTVPEITPPGRRDGTPPSQPFDWQGLPPLTRERRAEALGVLWRVMTRKVARDFLAECPPASEKDPRPDFL